jgi:hypothetical protein
MKHARARVRLEYLRCRVARVVVGRDHVVHTGVQVEGDLRVYDVGLVSGEDRQDEFHAACEELRRRSF